MNEVGSSRNNGDCAATSMPQVLQHVTLGGAARALTTPEADGGVLMGRFLEAGLETDALRLLPYLLPIRQAIWWGCLCSWYGSTGKPNTAENEAMRATFRWVRLPDADRWQEAEQAAKDDNLASAGGCCAQAVRWAGFQTEPGRWSHRNLPLAAGLVGGSVLKAIARAAPASHRVAHHRQLLSVGFEVARGEVSWERPAQR